MRLYKLIYLVYAAARAFLRATRLVNLVRPVIGVKAARFIYDSSGNASTPVMVNGHNMFLAPPGGYASPDMIAGKYETGTTRLFERLLKPGQTVVDIGSHAGYFALLSAKIVGDKGRVFAFEPEPENFKILSKNIELNGYKNITPVLKAVTNDNGSKELYLSALDNGFHSLNQLGVAEETEQETVSVAVTTLDTFLEEQGWPKVDLVKIDAEGAEPTILEGMNGLFDRCPEANLVVEFVPWIIAKLGEKPTSLIDTLTSLGFEVSEIQNGGCVSIDDSNLGRITDRLLQKDGYINLFCSRIGVSVSHS